MKKYLYSFYFMFFVFNILGQETFITEDYSIVKKDINGMISRIRFATDKEMSDLVEFYGLNISRKSKISTFSDIKNRSLSDSSVIVSAFLNNVIKGSDVRFKKVDDAFVDRNIKAATDESRFSSYAPIIRADLFKQYYNDIEVVDGFYNFVYKDEKILSINGNYINVDGINTNPFISAERAKEIFANYKNVHLDSIIHFNSELIIKELNTAEGIESESEVFPKLVYYVYLSACSLPMEEEELGYIDAHTGEILSTAPAMIDFDWHQMPATFHTLYYNSQTAYTDFYDNSYHLEDYTYNIFTWHIVNPIENDYPTYRTSFTDMDNVWTFSEMGQRRMALDIYWGLGRIYRRLRDTYSKFALGNNRIDSYINYFKSDNASWHFENKAMYFGSGNSYMKPLASLDVVAHELGHGMTQQHIGWYIGNNNQYAFHEGLSDIWAIIMGKNIAPWIHNWKIGDLIVNDGISTCIRNIANPNDFYARRQIASTYNSALYNSTFDPYVRGGVFSYWFYLLVNGRSGTNDNGRTYSVSGVGLDKAEALIVNAVFNGSLKGTSTYEQLKSVFASVAEDMDGINSNLVKQVTNAWYAVGVGDMQYNTMSMLNNGQSSIYKVYPNPVANGVIYIDSNDLRKTIITDNKEVNVGYTIRIYSITTGMTVNVLQNYIIGQAIDVSNLTNDLYTISIFDSDGDLLESLKLIKK